MKKFEHFRSELAENNEFLFPRVGPVDDPGNAFDTPDITTYKLEDPKILAKLNNFVGAISHRTYSQPELAFQQLRTKLNSIGLYFEIPEFDGEFGEFQLPVLQFNGRTGQIGSHGEFGSDDGISRRKSGGLHLSGEYKKETDGSYSIIAQLI